VSEKPITSIASSGDDAGTADADVFSGANDGKCGDDDNDDKERLQEEVDEGGREASSAGAGTDGNGDIKCDDGDAADDDGDNEDGDGDNDGMEPCNETGIV